MDKIDDFDCSKAQNTLRLLASGEKVSPTLSGMTRAHILFCRECKAVHDSLQGEIKAMSSDYHDIELIIDPKQAVSCEIAMKNLDTFINGVLGIVDIELAKKIELHMLVCDNCADAYGKILDKRLENIEIPIPPCPDTSFVDEWLEKEKKRKKRNSN